MNSWDEIFKHAEDNLHVDLPIRFKNWLRNVYKTPEKTNIPYVSDDFQIGPEGAYEHIEDVPKLGYDVREDDYDVYKPLLNYTKHKYSQDRCMGFIDGFKSAKENTYTEEEVTRIEVIDENGRQYTKWNCTIELSYQDDGRTLKIFVKNER